MPSQLVKIGSLRRSNSSCLFRIPDDGARVLWQVTNSCNYRCPYCIFGSGAASRKHELTTAEMLSTIEHLAKLGFSHIKFTGGEPFVRLDLMTILQHAADCGFSSDLSTNASLISRETAEKLASLNLTMVHVSVDGPDRGTHEAARGRNTYQPTMQGLKQLLAAGMYVRAGCVIFRGNQQLLEQMTRFCLELGVNELAFSLMEPAGRIKGDCSQAASIPVDVLIRQIESLALDYRGRIRIQHNLQSEINRPGEASCSSCPGGSRFIYIDNLGHVSPCTWVVENAAQFRSRMTLKQAGLETIMNSAEMLNYRRKIEEEKTNGNTGCPIRWSDFSAAGKKAA